MRERRRKFASSSSRYRRSFFVGAPVTLPLTPFRLDAALDFECVQSRVERALPELSTSSERSRIFPAMGWPRMGPGASVLIIRGPGAPWTGLAGLLIFIHVNRVENTLLLQAFTVVIESIGYT
jgi:hypothetical protein